MISKLIDILKGLSIFAIGLLAVLSYEKIEYNAKEVKIDKQITRLAIESNKKPQLNNVSSENNIKQNTVLNNDIISKIDNIENSIKLINNEINDNKNISKNIKDLQVDTSEIEQKIILLESNLQKPNESVIRIENSIKEIETNINTLINHNKKIEEKLIKSQENNEEKVIEKLISKENTSSSKSIKEKYDLSSVPFSIYKIQNDEKFYIADAKTGVLYAKSAIFLETIISDRYAVTKIDSKTNSVFFTDLKSKEDFVLKVK